MNEDDYGYRSVSHAGGMPGVSTELKLIPSENIAVVVLCNARNNLIYEIDNEILAVLLPRFAENLKAKKVKSEEKKPERFSPPKSLAGEWQGQIKMYAGIMPVQMIFEEDGDVHIKIKDQMETLLNDIGWNDGVLYGQFCGEIKTEEASRHPHVIQLNLKLRGQKLSGYVLALNDHWFGLSSWIQLKKADK